MTYCLVLYLNAKLKEMEELEVYVIGNEGQPFARADYLAGCRTAAREEQ